MAREIYRFEYNSGNDCQHNHRTWEAAEKCGRHLIAAAKAGKVFGHPISSDLLKDLDPAEVMQCVGVWNDGVRRGG
jgi:hypothetical protein